ncbi:unnamed protein product [Pleuronectes platessa]|uniref:Uncharacterized protein n=1 Tax=Pleuronectes platessa TaxID=8262 RepID=A0A9N7UQW0_PLEPL|nr:unnamed protein product [Pleuronectes platessa]
MPTEAHGHRGGMSGDEVAWIRTVASGALVYQGRGRALPCGDDNKHESDSASCASDDGLLSEPHRGAGGRVRGELFSPGSNYRAFGGFTSRFSNPAQIQPSRQMGGAEL